LRCDGRSMVCQAQRISPHVLIASLLKQLAVRWQPNNSLKLTRRAGGYGCAPGPLLCARILGWSARFRRVT
jgi:hypothetical protein